MEAGGLYLTGNCNREGGVYLNIYIQGRLLADVDLTPKQAKRLARKLKQYAREAEHK